MYDVVYADPPWSYNHSKSKSRAIENKYPTMLVDQIRSLEIPTKKNSVLFLWATNPKLQEALSVIDAWGFIYKTNMVWDKKIIGMGYWFRGQHELLLVATKGKFSPPLPHTRLSSVWCEKRTRHSKKPDGIREWIANVYPDKRKLEMFARTKSLGWDVFGNEIEGSIVLQGK